MTPAEHYAEAELLANVARNNPPDTPGLAELLARAQVHATLATVDEAVAFKAKDRGRS